MSNTNPVERSDLPEGQQSKELAEEIKTAAAVLLRQYDLEFDASHLSWQDFESAAREVVEAVTPILVARVRTQVAEDLRVVVEKAIKDWAVLYPIPANGLAGGDPRAEERLAANWASSATRGVFEALAEHAGKAFPSLPAALPDVVGTPDHPEPEESR